jgi:hypothetical protein
MTSVMARRSITSLRDTLSDRGLAALLALGIAAVGLLVFFDLGPPLAFNDDWVYAWAVRQLVAGHGLHLFPEQSVNALVGIVWAAAVTFGHTDQRLLRLSALPFVGLLVWSVWWLARRLGADPFWAAVASGGLLFQPVFLGVSTSFMTEPFYLGLLMLAAASGVNWLTTGRGLALTVLLAGLATLERPNGIGVAIAMTIAFLLIRRKVVDKRDKAALVAVLALSVLALAFPRLIGLQTQMQTLRINQLPNLDGLAVSIAYAPLLVGLLLIPFLGALFKKPEGRSRSALMLLLWFASGAALLFCLALLIATSFNVPGNMLGAQGLNPRTIRTGPKPELFGGLILTIEALAMITWLRAGVVHHRMWWPREHDPARVFLVVLGLVELVTLAPSSSFDRNYLSVVAPLLPVVAAYVSRIGATAAARNWAITSCLAGVLLYAVGQQDYQAWQAARDEAARQAYGMAGVLGVDAGYEANGTYAEIPRFEQGHGLLGQLTGPLGDGLPSIVGPAHPRLVLRFARYDDARPGVQYRSLASGKIIITERGDTASYKAPG